MLWHVCFLVYLHVISCQCGEPLDCSNKGSAKTTMMRLKLDLLCGYDKYLRPISHYSNTTFLGLLLAPMTIDFNDYTSTFHVKTWILMHWSDNHLTWDRLQYDDIDEITVDTSMVWVPGLYVYNAKAEADVPLDQQRVQVIIDYQGVVYTAMTPWIAGHCVSNWTNWPFDVHECTLTLGSNRYMGYSVEFYSLTGRGLLLRRLMPSKDWELVKTDTNRNEIQLGPKNETDSLYLMSLNYVFTLRRHASVYVATYLIPGVVMVVMSLGSLWIPSHRTGRTAILCTLVILQSLTLQFLSYKIPSNGDTTPYLVCFYRDCLFLTGLLIIQTIVTRSLMSCTSNPSYLRSTFRIVASNKVLQLILVNDLDPKNAAELMDTGNEEGATLVAADDNVQQWHMFVNIINRVCFVLLVPIYLLLSVSLMPVNYSFSPN